MSGRRSAPPAPQHRPPPRNWKPPPPTRFPAITVLFGQHAQAFQAVSAQATAFHEQCVRTLSAGGNSYALAESINAGPLQPLLDAINAPTEALLGRPLIGDGANGTAASPNGGAGGLLFGNGGNGYSQTSAGASGGAGGAAGLIGIGGLGGNGGAGGPAEQADRRQRRLVIRQWWCRGWRRRGHCRRWQRRFRRVGRKRLAVG